MFNLFPSFRFDEAEFWKHQEAEHTDLIPVVTPNLEAEYVAQLKKFGVDMRDIHSEIVKYIESSVRGGRTLIPCVKVDDMRGTPY